MCDAGTCLLCRRTALHQASEKGFVELVKALVEQGADVHAKDKSRCGRLFGSGSAYVVPRSLATLTRAFSWHPDMGRVIYA